MDMAYIVLTDSGGVQEEAPTFGKPLLVLRDVTERTEGIEVGVARLVGTDADRIVREALALLRYPTVHAAMTTATNPYGDGRASRRIVDVLATMVPARRVERAA
jgi:UDP-N-acetylglucosamine 2-epimerase (non-hydrolysing)